MMRALLRPLDCPAPHSCAFFFARVGFYDCRFRGLGGPSPRRCLLPGTPTPPPPRLLTDLDCPCFFLQGWDSTTADSAGWVGPRPADVYYLVPPPPSPLVS